MKKDDTVTFSKADLYKQYQEYKKMADLDDTLNTLDYWKGYHNAQLHMLARMINGDMRKGGGIPKQPPVWEDMGGLIEEVPPAPKCIKVYLPTQCFIEGQVPGPECFFRTIIKPYMDPEEEEWRAYEARKRAKQLGNLLKLLHNRDVLESIDFNVLRKLSGKCPVCSSNHLASD